MRRAALLAALALLLVAAGEPQSPNPMPLEQETEHVVLAGETLGGIASRAKVPRVLIAEANGLKEPYTIRAGQALKIPRTRRHKVAKGDTGFSVSYQYAVPWKDIAVANGIDTDTALKPGTTLLIPTLIRPPATASAAPSPAASAAAELGSRFAWPVAGTVRRGFTPRTQSNHHDGIDIKVAEGTAVRAAAAGKVLFAGEQNPQFGKLVVVDHGDGWHSAYAFLSKITVTKGEAVNQGERIGLSGHTGQARGSELHFELRNNAEPVDPAKLLPEAP
jgi:murein DD-endopeptidase MepM/ murein hydrolase activator NlpD